VFVRREDVERFIAEVRGDDPEPASKLRVEEREPDGGGAISLGNDLQLLVTARGIDKAFMHPLRIKANGDEEDVVAYQAKVKVLTAENVPTA